MDDTTTPNPSPKTPWHLWVVGVLSLLWNAGGALDFTMTETHNAAYLKQFTPEQVEYFAKFPGWLVVAWGIATWGSVLGSLALLLRSRRAGGLFVLSFVAMLVTMVHNLFLAGPCPGMGGPGPYIFVAAIFVIALLLIVYAKAMRRRGVLR